MSGESVDRIGGRWRLLRSRDGVRGGSLVRAADAFVRHLELPDPATWTDLQQAVEQVYSKPILLIASASSSLRAVTGLWIDTAEFGAVVCRESDQAHYQAQNAFHELAHILFAVAPDSWFTEDLPRTPAAVQGDPTLLCAYTAEQTVGRSRSEVAVEEVAFAMARVVQSLNRSSEETYFG